MLANITKVIEVPTYGIVTKVGKNVPIMLPTVLQASMIPQVLPFSSRLVTAYFTRFGVTIPKTISGNTNTSMQLTNAATTRYPVLTNSASTKAVPAIINFPTSGISIVHVAAANIQPKRRSGVLYLSAIRPPTTLPKAIAIIIVPMMIVHTICEDEK